MKDLANPRRPLHKRSDVRKHGQQLDVVEQIVPESECRRWVIG
jgi:hypothetical protein